MLTSALIMKQMLLLKVCKCDSKCLCHPLEKLVRDKVLNLTQVFLQALSPRSRSSDGLFLTVERYFRLLLNTLCFVTKSFGA